MDDSVSMPTLTDLTKAKAHCFHLPLQAFSDGYRACLSFVWMDVLWSYMYEYARTRRRNAFSRTTIVSSPCQRSTYFQQAFAKGTA
jgi:hypothetical protein